MGGGGSGILVGSPDSEHWSRVESGGWVDGGQVRTQHAGLAMVWM